MEAAREEIAESCIDELCTDVNKTCRIYPTYEKDFCFPVLGKTSITTSKIKTNQKKEEQNLTTRLSTVVKLYIKLMINFFNSLFTSERKQNSIKFKMLHASLPLKVFIILASLVFILQLLPLVSASDPLGNPYKILGIGNRATFEEIRKAYKTLAKEWHPDKNNDPAAQAKFVKIYKAYKLLSDPELRRRYDYHGITEEGLHRHTRESSAFNMPDPFEDFTAHFQRYPHFQTADISFFHKMKTTYRAYEKTIVPKSYQTPYLVLIYTDWCFACLDVQPMWQRLVEELEPLGVNLVTVHAEKEAALTRKLNIHSLPGLAVIINGRTSIYKESIENFRVQNIVEFLKNRFPFRLINYVNNDNIDRFLSGWTDNKIRALIFENKSTPRLRYLIAAFYHKNHVVFGFVQTGIQETYAITSKYKVSEELDTLLLFNENLDKPVAAVSMQNIPSDMMLNIIGKNKFLILPRLSNQVMLDSVCPQQSQQIQQKRLCAVLISENNPDHEFARHKFRQAALQAPYSQARVRYAYVFKETQPQFISALSTGEGSPMDPLHHIVIIWRRDSKNIKYEWFSSGWLSESSTNDNQWNETRLNLEETIHRLLKSSEELPFAAEIQELLDEHALSTMDKIKNNLMFLIDYLSDNLTKGEILYFKSVLAISLLVGLIGWGMLHLVKMEKANVQAKYGQFKESSKSVSIQPQLKLHEMRAETYNGLVRLIKPGCRTIVLLVDSNTKLKLLPAFHKAIWPYRKNKTLMFCHLSLDRGLQWFKKILTLSLPEPRELNINAKNCVGTVLSLNGHRKCFCMYHAKHPESKIGGNSKRIKKMTKRFTNSDDAEAGAFIGFDSSSDSEPSPDEQEDDVLYQDKLLDGLSNWLDRLFEGSTQRYYINYWPDFTVK